MCCGPKGHTETNIWAVCWAAQQIDCISELSHVLFMWPLGTCGSLGFWAVLLLAGPGGPLEAQICNLFAVRPTRLLKYLFLCGPLGRSTHAFYTVHWATGLCGPKGTSKSSWAHKLLHIMWYIEWRGYMDIKGLPINVLYSCNRFSLSTLKFLSIISIDSKNLLDNNTSSL